MASPPLGHYQSLNPNHSTELQHPRSWLAPQGSRPTTHPYQVANQNIYLSTQFENHLMGITTAYYRADRKSMYKGLSSPGMYLSRYGTRNMKTQKPTNARKISNRFHAGSGWYCILRETQRILKKKGMKQGNQKAKMKNNK